MFCSKCGSTIPERATFCAACGTPAVASSTAHRVSEQEMLLCAVGDQEVQSQRTVTVTPAEVGPRGVPHWLKAVSPYATEAAFVAYIMLEAITHGYFSNPRSFWVVLGLVAGTSAAVVLMREALVTKKGIPARVCYALAGLALVAESYALLDAANVAWAR